MKTHLLIEQAWRKSRLLPLTLAEHYALTSPRSGLARLHSSKNYVSMVDFQSIARVLPNGLPNPTRVLATAAFRVGDLHIRARFYLRGKQLNPSVKIFSVIDQASGKKAPLKLPVLLLAVLWVKMASGYVLAQRTIKKRGGMANV